MYVVTEQVNDEGALRELKKIQGLFGSLTAGKLAIRRTVPEKPQDGQVVICDGAHWNPIGDGVKRPVWFDKDTNTWKIFS